MKALIIDDERLARKELANLLEKYDGIEVVGEAANADEAEHMITEKRPDLLFLDINMPGRTGFDLLEALDQAPHVIFVTAYDEHALKAFEVNALDYLLKPIDPERLDAAVNKLQAKAEADPQQREVLHEADQIFLKDGEKCWFVTLKDVRYFESEGNYVRVRFHDQKPLVLRSLNKLEEKLDPLVFFRANRKHIVNLRWVDKIEPWFSGGLMVKLRPAPGKAGQEPEQLEVSRRQATRFKELLSL
ncbi:MAG: LytTR family DNA-binding domain-containing protein [Flavobacteriales bacterium]|nr:response regulator transcription factor [Flavobacteriales bacterium]